MDHLYEPLAEKTLAWREAGYPCEEFPAIRDLLKYQVTGEEGGRRELRFLREPQLRALETYWYLRLVEGTPHVLALYEKLFSDPVDLLSVLASDDPELGRVALRGGLSAVWDRVKTDDDFVKQHRLEALRETLTLAYPSYIFALAMGAGKTILIGAIIATEFGMALEYPDGGFVQNALVFAPGKTIIEALRPLTDIPYDRILPPYMYGRFAPSVKLTFTRDGDPDIPVIEGSVFNIVVTNTEKIRIQKTAIRKADLGAARLFTAEDEDAARAEVANRRLSRIASLPHLAIFSDEAHHTYGQSLATGLKRVRQTVDYLADNTNLICVVNTTGTPYFKRQMLRDVVVWYSLSSGIRDGYLKEVEGSIYSYDFDNAHTVTFVREVIRDFFTDYGETTLPNGAPARLALYFPQVDDLQELRPAVEEALLEVGLTPALCLENHSGASEIEVDAFNRLNDPNAPHRVILLVNKGTEGWDCPSLFACALARRLTSTNFVLQAASRCLRQVQENKRKARIYLSADNEAMLDQQLQENYGETLRDLDRQKRATGTVRLVVRKTQIEPVRVRQIVRTVVPEPVAEGEVLRLERPALTGGGLERSVLGLVQGQQRVLHEIGQTVQIDAAPASVDVYGAAVELAGLYRRDFWPLYRTLKELYSDADGVPLAALEPLAKQIEQQTCGYRVVEETIEMALALIREEGFDHEDAPDGTRTYTTQITYPLDRENLLVKVEDWRDNPAGLGFHYTPYNFDSQPERSFLEDMLAYLSQRPEEVEDIYFTGALTDPNQTDFYVGYQGTDGRLRFYTPDFVIRRRDGKVLIVEIKAQREKDDAIEGLHGKKAEAARAWERADPEGIAYEMIFTSLDSVTHQQARDVRGRFEHKVWPTGESHE